MALSLQHEELRGLLKSMPVADAHQLLLFSPLTVFELGPDAGLQVAPLKGKVCHWSLWDHGHTRLFLCCTQSNLDQAASLPGKGLWRRQIWAQILFEIFEILSVFALVCMECQMAGFVVFEPRSVWRRDGAEATRTRTRPRNQAQNLTAICSTSIDQSDGAGISTWALILITTLCSTSC
jgi:hypothetical protein